MRICPVKPPHVPGRFAAFEVPYHAQDIIGIEGKHVKSKDVKGERYKKREKGKGKERRVAKPKPDPRDMEPPAFRQGPECFKHF